MFVANGGQAHPSVRMHAVGSRMPVFFTDHDVRLVLTKDGRQTAVFLELVGSHGRFGGDGPGTGSATFMTGKHAVAALPMYREVRYGNAWPGIEASFRDDGGSLTYEFLLAPGADVDLVRLRVRGVEDLVLDADGNLQLVTPLGTLTDTAPRTFQLVNGERRPLESRFVLHPDRTVGFALGAHDPSLPVLIDPSLVYATFLGGSGDDFGRAIAVDQTGAAYVAGRTTPGNFPVTPGAVDTVAVNAEGFVAKLTRDGRFFEYVTYLGGAGADDVYDIAVDAAGSAYVAGTTASADFPVTPGAFRTTKGSGEVDGFVAKLDSNGTRLLYSTYLGGNHLTFAYAVAVDHAGQAHVAGTTEATNLPTTAAAIRWAPAGSDGFLLKFDAGGRSVLYGTYLGGNQADTAVSVDLDAAGYAYVSGATTSPDVRTTAAAYRRTVNPDGDVYAVKINPAAANATAALVYGTYLNTWGGGGAVDPQTQAFYVIGYGSAEGSALPTPQLLKLHPSGSALEYRRRVGPERPDSRVTSIAVDGDGQVYVGGFFDDTLVQAFISRVDANGLEASRFELGGNSHSTVYGVSVGADATVFATGWTSDTAFPVTAAAPQPRFGGGGSDAFVAQVSFAGTATSNVAAGRGASASSTEASAYPAANAFDGDLSTRWSSRFSDPQWLAVDLGQRYRVERVVLFWETAHAAEYELHISDDGVNWYPLQRPQPSYLQDPRRDGGVDNHVNLNGTGRYVRMFGRQRATPWGYSLWEMQVFGTPVSGPAPPPGSVNLARNAYASASSVENERLLPGQAIDGHLGTRWSSAFQDPQYLALDLGATVNISRVVLRWETAFGRDYQIQVSSGDGLWSTVRSVVNGDGDVDVLSDLNAVGRYIRVYGTKRGTPWGYSLWEFEVYGVIRDGGASPPPAVGGDVVLYAAQDAGVLQGLSRVADPTAAGGSKVSSEDLGRAWLHTPPAAGSAPYAVYTFDVAVPGRYSVWLRLRAQAETKWNDSVWVQFSHATRDGAPVYQIGSNDGLLVNLENCSGCGVQGWGWQDNSWWLNQPAVVQLPAGTQRLQIALREDGVEFDQIVLSRERYAAQAPGALKNDSTIVPKP